MLTVAKLMVSYKIMISSLHHCMHTCGLQAIHTSREGGLIKGAKIRYYIILESDGESYNCNCFVCLDPLLLLSLLQLNV